MSHRRLHDARIAARTTPFGFRGDLAGSGKSPRSPLRPGGAERTLNLKTQRRRTWLFRAQAPGPLAGVAAEGGELVRLQRLPEPVPPELRCTRQARLGQPGHSASGCLHLHDHLVGSSVDEVEEDLFFRLTPPEGDRIAAALQALHGDCRERMVLGEELPPGAGLALVVGVVAVGEADEVGVGHGGGEAGEDATPRRLEYSCPDDLLLRVRGAAEWWEPMEIKAGGADGEGVRFPGCRVEVHRPQDAGVHRFRARFDRLARGIQLAVDVAWVARRQARRFGGKGPARHQEEVLVAAVESRVETGFAQPPCPAFVAEFTDSLRTPDRAEDLIEARRVELEAQGEAGARRREDRGETAMEGVDLLAAPCHPAVVEGRGLEGPAVAVGELFEAVLEDVLAGGSGGEPEAGVALELCHGGVFVAPMD